MNLQTILEDGAPEEILAAYRDEYARYKSTLWTPCRALDIAICHTSENDPEKVAYLKDTAALMRILPDSHPTRPGERDALYTRTTPGRAIKALCPDMPDAEVQRHANEYLAQIRGEQYTLHILDNGAPEWAENAKALQNEWHWLYDQITVDYSCMRGSHGPRAYGLPGNGLGLAYLSNGDGALMVRAIVKLDQSPVQFHRVFPSGDMDLDKARAFFTAQGFDEDASLDGYKLALVEHPHHGGSWCLPYIDGAAQMVDLYDGFMRICKSGDYTADNTTGYLDEDEEDERTTCDCCGERYDDEDLHYIEREDRHICRDCLEADYTLAYVGRREQDYVPNDEVIYCESNNEYYRDSYASEADIYACEICGDYYHIDDLMSTSMGLIHESYCVELYQEDGDGNAYAYKDDVTVIEHPYTGESRTYHEDDADGIAEWNAEIEADKAEAEAEAKAEEAEEAEEVTA